MPLLPLFDCKNPQGGALGGASLDCINMVVPMNPCPCGYFGSDRECHCAPKQIQQYLKKVSGPFLDRIDIQIEVSRLAYQEIAHTATLESSSSIRARVKQAQEIQQEQGTRTSRK